MSYNNIIYKIKELPLFQRILIILFLIRALAAFIYCFLPFDMPHVVRQTDTLAVSIRYWSRWAYEPNLGNQFIPAVLNSGASYGYMPSEFPFMTIITAPFFYFGPYWGKVLACLFIWLIVFTLTLINLKIWRNIYICGLSAFSAMLLLPMFSFSASISWRFIPDFIAVQLCLVAVGLTWEKNQIIKPFFLTLVGLLLKPVTIIVFPLYLTHKNIWQKKSNLIWLVPVTLICYFYYTTGIVYIDKFREIPIFFKVNKDIGISSIIDFFSQFNELVEFLNYHPLFPYGFLIVIFIYSYFSIKNKKLMYFKIWLAIVLQILMIATLDGSHSFVHFYYWFGISPSFCLIALGAWKMLEENPNYVKTGVKSLLVILFLSRFFEIIYLDVRGISSEKRINSSIPYIDCLTLKNRNSTLPWNTGYVFLSENIGSPFLGVCFGERTNYPGEKFGNPNDLFSSKLNAGFYNNFKYGFFFLNHQLPTYCKIIDKSGKVVLVACELR